MGEYINGSYVGPRQIVDNIGRVFDVEYTLNEEKTKKNLVDWLAYNSSVKTFSDWKHYYDFDMAGRETIQAFLRDVNSHRDQVKEHLMDLDAEYLMRIKKDIPDTMKNNEMADEVLRRVGYKFTPNKQKQ